MGAKAKKKAVVKTVKKASTLLSASKGAAPDFLPLEGGPARDLPRTEDRENKATVLYIGRIPHGFYENEMEAFFKQFGTVKRLRIARNKKTGKSKHYGFIEFESPEVAKVVEECMHNYIMYEHLLQVRLVPPERVHPKIWKCVNRLYKPIDWVQIERKRHDKERTLEQQKKLLAGIVRRDQKRRKRIAAAGVPIMLCPPACMGTLHSLLAFDVAVAGAIYIRHPGAWCWTQMNMKVMDYEYESEYHLISSHNHLHTHRAYSSCM